ncbi:unnamed protein product [Merluccius merluccius]
MYQVALPETPRPLQRLATVAVSKTVVRMPVDKGGERQVNYCTGRAGGMPYTARTDDTLRDLLLLLQHQRRRKRSTPQGPSAVQGLDTSYSLLDSSGNYVSYTTAFCCVEIKSCDWGFDDT